MRTFKTFIIEGDMNEAHKEIVVPWDMDDPKEYADDFLEVGVYLNQWDKRKGTITVDGDEKDLLKWLTDEDAMAMSKGEALKYIRKGKKV